MVIACKSAKPPGFKSAPTFAKYVPEIPGADRLDHLDGHELVVAALQIAVVVQEHGDAIAEPRRRYTPKGERMLFPRDGGRGDMTAEAARGMQGKAAPSGADLDHRIARRELERRADGLELARRGRFERVLLPRPERRGIHEVGR